MDAYLTLKEVCKIVRLSEATITRMALDGELAAWDAGSKTKRRLRFSPDAVRALEESRRVGPATKIGDKPPKPPKPKKASGGVYKSIMGLDR